MNQQWGPKVDDGELGSDLLERWALHYLGRYASSAENLRRVLTRRVRRRYPQAVRAAAPMIVALIARYRESGLLDDAVYAAARVQAALQASSPSPSLTSTRPPPACRRACARRSC